MVHFTLNMLDVYRFLTGSQLVEYYLTCAINSKLLSIHPEHTKNYFGLSCYICYTPAVTPYTLKRHQFW